MAKLLKINEFTLFNSEKGSYTEFPKTFNKLERMLCKKFSIILFKVQFLK
ncbi:Uncharacterised protein [Sphingobacterium daejeonense]|nr:Uncharacterised protein [Sphingobacterium daejeonense]